MAAETPGGVTLEAALETVNDQAEEIARLTALCRFLKTAADAHLRPALAELADWQHWDRTTWIKGGRPAWVARYALEEYTNALAQWDHDYPTRPPDASEAS